MYAEFDLKRSKTIQLGLVCTVAAGLLACDDRPTRYCVDGNDQVQDELNCAPGHAGHWYYGHGGYTTGARVSGGSTTVPSEGFSTPSGTVRGGIGEAGEAASSGGHGGGGE